MTPFGAVWVAEPAKVYAPQNQKEKENQFGRWSDMAYAYCHRILRAKQNHPAHHRAARYDTNFQFLGERSQMKV